MRKTKLSIGILAATLAVPLISFAQDDVGELEEIIVTGSLIKGTPEDANLPVEVHTAEDLELEGSPSALEFAKSLTSAGPTSGEAYYFSGAENTGNVQYNLRGIGADKTLVLFNGRRINENTSILPSIATQRIEVLKDGAAVTYGADATGGVVNFITMDDFEGIKVKASYKAISDSDGDYTMGILGGFGGDDTRFVWAAEWDHRSELDAVDRDFSNQPYAVNPQPWSTLTNLARWFQHGSLPATLPTPANPPVLTAGVIPTGEFGAYGGPTVTDYTQGSCEAVGGIYEVTATGTNCKYGYVPFYNIVEDQEIYRLFGQVTSQVTDTSEFYLRTAFSRVYVPHAYGSPSQPVVRGPARHNGLVAQFYVPKANPFVNEFETRTGAAASGGYTAVTYRAFAHGGNDTFAEGSSHSTPREIDNRYFHISTGINGDFNDSISYDFGLTFNQSYTMTTNPDILAFRLQEALNGFGGPNCNAEDEDLIRYGTQNPTAAGTNGCQWYNPFSTNFVGNPVLGLANPNYIDSSYLNSPELNAWLFDERRDEETRNDITVDFVLSGLTQLEMPGGNLGWAAGAQWRTRNLEEYVESNFYNGSQPCLWPADSGQRPLPSDDEDFTSCGDGNPGPFQFFGINPPDRLDQKQQSVFAELSLPALDSLYFSLAARWEQFNESLDATVYKVSGKWDVTDNLSFRGSYGTNYQAPGIGVIPGSVVNGVNSYSIAGNNWLGATTVTRDDIEPETATVWSFGTIWQSAGFSDDHDFRVIVDYFSIETEDELALLATANDIAGAVFHISNPTPGARNFADCSHPLAGRVTFNGGTCTQGTTTAGDFASITTEFGNGPSQTTAGFDIQIDYSLPVSDGDLSFGFTATKLQELEDGPTTIDGYTINSGADRLGNLNFAVVGGAGAEWRANFNTNYRLDVHNFRAVLSYVSGVDDERFFLADGSFDTSLATPAGYQTGTSTPFAPSTYGINGDDWVALDFHYTANFEWGTINASIANLTDEEPPASRQELGYDPLVGNPLGRTLEIGFSKEF